MSPRKASTTIDASALKPRLPTRDTLALLVRLSKRAGNCIRAAKGNEASIHEDEATRRNHHALARTMYLEAEADLRELEAVARAAADDLKAYRATLRRPVQAVPPAAKHGCATKHCNLPEGHVPPCAFRFGGP